MKKIVLCLLFLIICGCENLNNLASSNNVVTDKVEQPEYIDKNPVKISMYIDNAFGGLDIARDEFHDTWRPKRDIVILSSLYSQEEVIAEDYFQNMWKNAALKYDNYEQYKTGWYINFKLKDSTIIDQMIKSPTDVEYFYDYLELYLYDSANQPIGTWYSHLTAEDMKDNTILTTLKLTAGSKFDQIESPITISVYTYDDLEDFDNAGKYRGNSLSTIKVYND